MYVSESEYFDILLDFDWSQNDGSGTTLQGIRVGFLLAGVI